jgi:hypothetical protein
VHNFRKLVEEILGHLEPATAAQIKHRPRYIQLIGDVAPMMITRIIREGAENEASSEDYDFSRRSIEQHKRDGYKMAKEALDGRRRLEIS